MTAYLIRRLLAAVMLLFVVSAVTFAIFFLVPRLGGQTADELAVRFVGKDANADSIAAVKDSLGLDQPLIVQYADFIKAIFVGAEYKFGPTPDVCDAPCFGYSFRRHIEVWPEITQRLPITLSLAIGAAVLWVISGVTIGIISALKRGTFVDRLAMTVALLGVSLPIFFTGLLGLALFTSQWPIWESVEYVPITEDPGAWFWNLIIPWCSLAFLYSALYARLTRAGMLETMSEDYIRTARAKGLRESKVVVRHGLRAALTPIVTIFGMDFALLLGGAVITEQVFSLQGMGAYAVQAVQDSDLPIVMGVTLCAAFFIVFCNLIVDLLYAAIDPRVRYS